MAFSSPSSHGEQLLYIDPRRLVYGSGGGVDDPHYNDTAPTTEDSIDLDKDASFRNPPEYIRQTSDPNGTLPIEQDAGHYSISEIPPPSSPFRLRPEAQIFVPGAQPPLTLTLDTQLQPEHAACHSGAVTPRTPEIKVFQPADSQLNGNAAEFRSGKQKARARSAHSSPGPRSSSISRQRYRKDSSRSSLSNGSGRALLAPLMNVAPANWIMTDGYHVGDYLAHSRTQKVEFQPSTLRPGYQYFAPTPSTTPSRTSQGYRCTHPGCDEPDRVWETASARNHHRLKHNPKNKRPHACRTCNERFQYPKDVTRHQVVHNENAQHVCLVCDKRFGRRDNLNRHITTVHGHAQTPTSGSPATAMSPSASSATSFVHSPTSDTLPSTPMTLSPLMAKSTPSFSRWKPQYGSLMDDDDDPFFDSSSQTPLSAQPMSKSYSNLT